MRRPSCRRRCARAAFTSSSTTSSPARVSCAPTSPPSAPAPTNEYSHFGPPPTATWLIYYSRPAVAFRRKLRCPRARRRSASVPRGTLALPPLGPRRTAGARAHGSGARSSASRPHSTRRRSASTSSSAPASASGATTRETNPKAHISSAEYTRPRAVTSIARPTPMRAGEPGDTDRRKEAEPDLRLPEGGTVAGEQDVRHHGELEPRTERRAIDRDHDRQLALAKRGKEAAEGSRSLRARSQADVRRRRRPPRRRVPPLAARMP